jgi:hypothetical protein
MGPRQRWVESQRRGLTRREPGGFRLGVVLRRCLTLVQCSEKRGLLLADWLGVGSETNTGLASDAEAVALAGDVDTGLFQFREQRSGAHTIISSTAVARVSS